jgi:HTH-type transcriptional regulator, quorum sensing regulator NprR
MVYANCILDKTKFKSYEFEEAEKEYFEIFDMAKDDKSLLALGYRNLAELYFKIGKYKEASQYIKDALIHSNDNEYLEDILYFASKILTDENENIEKYLLEALDVFKSKDKNNVDLIKNVINDLIVIYMKREDEDNIITLTKKAEELKIDCNKIYAQLIKYYRCRNIAKSEYFNDILINKLS